MADPTLCSSCQHYVLTEEGRHECHLHPPEGHARFSHRDYVWQFPKVEPNQACCADAK